MKRFVQLPPATMDTPGPQSGSKLPVCPVTVWEAMPPLRFQIKVLPAVTVRLDGVNEKSAT